MVVNVAIPPLTALVESVVAPSLNVTVPVADEGDTVAVSVTVSPTEGLAGNADKDVELVALPIVRE